MLNDKIYMVKFNLNNRKPITIKVYTCVPYWNDISQEQREMEVKYFAMSELEDRHIYIDENNITSVEIKEIS